MWAAQKNCVAEHCAEFARRNICADGIARARRRATLDAALPHAVEELDRLLPLARRRARRDHHVVVHGLHRRPRRRRLHRREPRAVAEEVRHRRRLAVAAALVVPLVVVLPRAPRAVGLGGAARARARRRRRGARLEQLAEREHQLPLALLAQRLEHLEQLLPLQPVGRAQNPLDRHRVDARPRRRQREELGDQAVRRAGRAGGPAVLRARELPRGGGDRGPALLRARAAEGDRGGGAEIQQRDEEEAHGAHGEHGPSHQEPGFELDTITGGACRSGVGVVLDGSHWRRTAPLKHTRSTQDWSCTVAAPRRCWGRRYGRRAPRVRRAYPGYEPPPTPRDGQKLRNFRLAFRKRTHDACLIRFSRFGDRWRGSRSSLLGI